MGLKAVGTPQDSHTAHVGLGRAVPCCAVRAPCQDTALALTQQQQGSIGRSSRFRSLFVTKQRDRSAARSCRISQRPQGSAGHPSRGEHTVPGMAHRDRHEEHKEHGSGEVRAIKRQLKREDRRKAKTAQRMVL